MSQDLSHSGDLSAHSAEHPVDIDVVPQLTNRNRLTCAFRPLLAIPHLLLVGGPIGFAITIGWRGDAQPHVEWGGSAGIFGAAIAVVAMIAWFAILFGSTFPPDLWRLSAAYMRWRLRVSAYLTLLRDEYPPFGDAPYPAMLTLREPERPRDRLTVAFRLLLALPHLVAVWLLGVALAFTTLAAWFAIIFTGMYPPRLYDFAVGVLRWSTRVEAYVLLLHDEFPPVSFD
jgi:hypothetical protein